MQRDESPQAITTKQDEPLLNPNWFAGDGSPPQLQKKGFFKTHRKILLLLLSVIVILGLTVAVIQVTRGGAASANQASFSVIQAAYQDLQRDLTGIYVTDIDDINTEQIQHEWEVYLTGIQVFKDTDAYKDAETRHMVDELETQSLRYEKFVAALPALYDYFNNCNPSDIDYVICKEYMQTIIDFDDPLTKGPASAILAAMNQPPATVDELASQLATPEETLVSAADGLSSLEASIQALDTRIQAL